MRWPLLLLVLVGISDAAPRKKEPTQPATFDDPCTIMADGELWPDVRRLDVRCRPAAVRCAIAAGR